MKKVLFATTALVAFAGAAAADVKISGHAELGIADTDVTGAAGAAVPADAQDVGFFSSIDVYFDMTGETDNGLAFGASIDLDDAGGSVDESGNAFADYTVFVSGAFGTLTLGDTDGALDWAMTEGGNVGNGGSISDAETGHAGYLGAYLDGAGDNTVLRYNYAAGDLGLAVSVEQSTIGATVANPANPADGETGYALGLRYSVDMGGASVALGAGVQNATFDGNSNWGPLEAAGAVFVAGVEGDTVGVSAAVTAGAFQVGLAFTQNQFDNAAGVEVADIDHTALGVSYAVGALTLHANYGDYDGTIAGVAASADGVGLSAAYDLGGGASMHFGYGDGDVTVGGVEQAGNTAWSLGLSMAF